MNINKWIKENTQSLKGKTVAITGSTGGLAKHLTTMLANLNSNLILINRNTSKTEKQISELKSLYPDIKVDFIQCDLSDFGNVRSATEILKQKKIDILYLAAGIYNVNRFKTDIGFNNIFQTNFVAHYYMIKELLPQLNAVNGKVIAVSSIAHNYSSIDENDIDFSTRKKHSEVYGNSKRFLMFALYELMKNQKAKMSIVHPGITLTEMTNHYPKAINWLVKIGIKIFFPSAESASLSLIKGIFDETNFPEWIGPKTFNIWGNPKKQKIKKYDNNEIKKIFNIAEKIYTDIQKSTIT